MFLVLAGLVPWSGATAQHHLSGSVGADLGMYGFTDDVFAKDPLPLFPGPRDLGYQYDADRSMSNQWLDLNATGPLVNGYFASYNARMRLQGTQIRSSADGISETEYLKPAVTNYYGSVGLFPSRPFPLMLYTGKTQTHNVRYEPNNRTQEIEFTGLAVVRRYKSTTEGTGAQWRYAVTPDLELGLEGKTTHTQLERQYDFDENRNIDVKFFTTGIGVAPDYSVDVVNTIPDHDVLLFIDGILIDTVPAGDFLPITVEEGVHRLEFVPVGLNSFTHTLTVNSEMEWKIFFTDPPGSKDLDQYNDIISGKMQYGRNGRFTDETYFEYNDGREMVQKMVTNLQVFNNLATYHLTPNATFNSLTNYSRTLTDVDTTSHNLSSAFMQQTNHKWRRPGSLGTSLTHSYFYMTSETDIDHVSSRNNIVNGLVNIPTHWNRHELDLLAGVNLLADSKSFKNNQYTTEMRNRLETRLLGMRWRPLHNLKFSRGKQQNMVDDPVIGKHIQVGNNKEAESKFRVEGEHPGIGPLGSLRLLGEWTWRQKINDKGVDTRNKKIGEIGLTRKFGRKYKFKVITGWEKETFDFVDENDDPGARSGATYKEPELRQSFRIDGQAAPVPWFDLSANAIWIKTNESRIEKFSVSVSLKIPKLKIPIKSFVTKENRELIGVRPQKVLKAETKLSYNIRKIRLVVSHKYTDETLITERYTYSEFLASISRDFDIY